MFNVPGIYHVVPAMSGGFSMRRKDANSDEEMKDKWISRDEMLCLLEAMLGTPENVDSETMQMLTRAIAGEAPAPAPT